MSVWDELGVSGDTSRVLVGEHTRNKPNRAERRKILADVPIAGVPTPMGPMNLDRELVAGLLAPTLGQVGGTIGAAAGPAASIGGAGIGGTVGKTLEQALTGSLPETPGQFAQENLGSGALQAGFQAAPLAIGKGAEQFMKIALKSSPEVARTAIQEGITASKTGFEKLKGLISRTAGAERQIVRRAAQNGKGFIPSQDLADGAWQKAMDALKGGTADDWSKLAELRDKFVRDNAEKLNPVGLLDKRKYYDTLTGAARRAVRAGGKNPLNPNDVWERAIGDQIREHLGNTVPGIKDPNAYKSIIGRAVTPADLQNLKDVLIPAAKKGGLNPGRYIHSIGSLGAGAAVGGLAGSMFPSHRLGSAAGSVAGAGLATPAALSTMALLGANPALAAALGLIPRLGQAAIGSQQ